MKHFFTLLSACMIFLIFGCTTEMQSEKTDTKVETSATQINPGNELRVHFIDVGQGDSIFIQSPDGKTMLIDGGKRDSGKEVVDYLRAQGVKKLDYVVATHPDADHIGGLLAVLNSISINHFIDSGKIHTSQTYENMLQLIVDKKIPFVVPDKGDKISLDSNMDITVFNVGEESDDNNEASIVLKVQYGEVSFLLTGDADIKVEKSMMKQYNLQSTFLKAGHHGSDTSTSEDFIRAVKPEVTILSYGKDNSYGHPKQEVVNHIKKVKSQAYATAEVGNIVVTTNGVDYSVSTQDSPDKVEAKKTVSTPSIVILNKDLQGEIVGIKNTGDEAVNLEGWKLISTEGNQVFTFPNMDLEAGKTIYITSGPSAKEGHGYLHWTKRQVWRNDGDAASLINEKGEVISEVK